MSFGLNAFGLGGAGSMSLAGDVAGIVSQANGKHPRFMAASVTSEHVFGAEWTEDELFNIWGTSSAVGTPMMPAEGDSKSAFSRPVQHGLTTSHLPITFLGGQRTISMVDGLNRKHIHQWNAVTQVWDFDTSIHPKNIKAIWQTQSDKSFILYEDGTYATSCTIAFTVNSNSVVKKPILGWFEDSWNGMWYNDTKVLYRSTEINNVTDMCYSAGSAIVLQEGGLASYAGRFRFPSSETGWTFLSSGVQSIASTLYAHFMLSINGSVYAIGAEYDHMSFGMAMTTAVQLTPVNLHWVDSLINPLNRHFSITHMMSNGFTIFIYASAVSVTSTCPGTPPGPTFECKNGIWVSEGSVTLPSGSTSPTFTGPIQVNGNLTADSSTTIVLAEGLGTLINVSGCATISGTIQITISEDDLESLSKDKGGRTISLLQASCGSAVDARLDLKLSGKSCKKVNGKPVVTFSSDGSSSYTLSGVLSVSRGSCDRWWIILVSVVGGVLLLVIIIALLAAFTPLKSIIRPFTKREKASHNQIE
jgi:hypothetical protein